MSNDTSHIYTIIIFFIFLGFVIGYMGTYFSVDYIENQKPATYQGNDFVSNLTGDTTDEVTVSTAWDKVKDIFRIFFWSFQINWIVELFLIEPFRIIGYVIIYRLIRSGSG